MDLIGFRLINGLIANWEFIEAMFRNGDFSGLDGDLPSFLPRDTKDAYNPFHTLITVGFLRANILNTLAHNSDNTSRIVGDCWSIFITRRPHIDAPAKDFILRSGNAF
jgi:hypothetical protein